MSPIKIMWFGEKVKIKSLDVPGRKVQILRAPNIFIYRCFVFSSEMKYPMVIQYKRKIL